MCRTSGCVEDVFLQTLLKTIHEEMSLQIQFVFLTLISIFMSSVVMSAKIQCNRKSMDELDENLMKLSVLGHPNRKYPSNDKDAQAHCQEDMRLTAWGKNYSSTCMTGPNVEMSRHVTTLIMHSMASVARKRCRTETTRKVFIRAGTCGNSVQKETTKCFRGFIRETEQINKFKDNLLKKKQDKDLLPLVCCAYHKFYDCNSDAYSEPKFVKTCPERNAVELESYTRESLYDVIQYLCGDYQGSDDRCDQLRLRHKDLFNTVRVKSLSKSPLGPANQIFDSLPTI